LIRTVGRTAVIAGTATVVSGRVGHRQQQRYATEEAAQLNEIPDAMPSSAPEPAYAQELVRLSQLRAEGIITDAEYEAKKKNLLGI
jgi:Short C-terminal domain